MKNNKEQNINYFENSKKLEHQEFIISETHCVLCGTSLELHYIQEKDSALIQEDAHCPNCNLKTRSHLHTVQ
ncbi:MAG: hypothetical protein ACOYOK_05025 [Pseudobdellovibrionaceae bacterium]